MLRLSTLAFIVFSSDIFELLEEAIVGRVTRDSNLGDWLIVINV